MLDKKKFLNFYFEGKKKSRKIKPLKLKVGRKVVKYSAVDKWLSSIQLLLQDLEELNALKKKAEKKIKKISSKNSTKSKSEQDDDANSEKNKNNKADLKEPEGKQEDNKTS